MTEGGRKRARSASTGVFVALVAIGACAVEDKSKYSFDEGGGPGVSGLGGAPNSGSGGGREVNAASCAFNPCKADEVCAERGAYVVCTSKPSSSGGSMAGAGAPGLGGTGEPPGTSGST